MSITNEQTSSYPKTGAELLIECLRAERVDTIFGYPGGAVIPIYDALYDCREILHVLTRHEQAAVHAADGYARVTGRTGVALVTSGPGATNAVTGIANAYMDSVPMVVLTGQVSTDLIGRDSFQEVNIYGMTMDVTKHNYSVMDIRELPRIVKEAFHLAVTGRPGPVLIDLPKNIMAARTDLRPAVESISADTNRNPRSTKRLYVSLPGRSSPPAVRSSWSAAERRHPARPSSCASLRKPRKFRSRQR